ncbi:S8 family serine peptidase [Georgenia faecalis]|uniref:S8 family serine peptidase n=1 Tax=Georgenia faecalis TaxID=2483799 RepID=A0ABV9D8S4_9MICO|nr:S8 family serine peptidase [Georgenia faecalis]
MSRARPRLLAALTAATLIAGLAPAAAGAPSDRDAVAIRPAATSAPAPGAPRAEGATVEGADVTATTSVPRDEAKGTVMRLGSAPQAERYIVQLAQPAVSAYEGGIAQLQATRPEPGDQLDPAAAPVQEYVAYLADEQADLRARIAAEIGHTPTVDFTYAYALNGIAVALTADEAAAVAELPGVTSVVVDVERMPQSDNGPRWIGAPAIWEGTATGVATRGEGIVVGVLDTGVNPSNPSFADSVPLEDGGDGYDHTNPRGAGTYVGICDPANTAQYDARFACNDKLIGAWDFVGDGPFDTDGHGSHTASTAAGNQVAAVVEGPSGISETRTISGVAPHANLITYDVCVDGCSTAAITAAIDQAIRDEVDVINYSIGGDSPSNAWSDPDAQGFLAARAAGIFVATSAGNDGPDAETLGSPADVPWITSVAASTHDRTYPNTVTDLTRADGEGLAPIEGLGFTTGHGSAPVVYAGDFGDPLCQAGAFEDGELDGLIVVCDRGVNGRVEKGQVVADAGAAGMILANDEPSGASLTGDAHVLPAVHISYDDGVVLKAWLAEGEGHTARITGATLSEDPADGDITADFSSRGPNRAMDIVSPSVSAPGVDILAAAGVSTADAEVEPYWTFISGTSMASPHVAGAGALLVAQRPDWSPAELQSALMTTAERDLTKEDGVTPADPFDQGSGRVDLDAAARAGLVLDESVADYEAANPAEGGDPSQLNLASMANGECLQECSWTRTLTGDAPGSVTWTASVTSAEGVTLTVEPATFTLADGATQDITVTAQVSAAELDVWAFGEVVLTPSAEGVPDAAFPVAVLPSAGVLPDEVVIDTRRDAGSQLVEGLRAVAISDLHIEAAGLTPSQTAEYSLAQDPTNTDPYDTPAGTTLVRVDVPEGASRLVVEVTESTATDIDLFVGRGEAASLATEECRSATAGALESCDIGAPEAGAWWVLVQNWEASAAGATDTLTLGTAVVVGDAGNLWAEGPATHPAAEPFDLRVFYDEPALEAGQRWYGALTLGSSPDGAGDIGILPVTLNRFPDDVTKTADVETAAPGDTVTYEVTVAPNVTDEDLTYSLTDTIPEGMTYVEGSATGGATVTDGVLEWEGVLPTAVGAQGSYVITRSGEDPACANPFNGTGYVDLATLGNFRTDAGISGDTKAFTVSSPAPFSFYGVDYNAITLTDDGFVVFDVMTHYAGTPWVPQALPSPAAPNNLLAMLWQDMEIVYDAATNRGVTLVNLGGTVPGSALVIEYDDVQLLDDPESTYDVELFAFRGQDDTPGAYEFYVAYDNVSGPVDGPLTIGAEDATGTAGQALVNGASGEGVVADDSVVCFDYQGVSFDPVTITYQATVDDEGLANGDVLTNEVTHVTDNPGAQPVTVGVDVTVEGVVAPTPVVTVERTQDAREPRTNGVFTFTRTGDLSAALTVGYEVDLDGVRVGRDIRALDGTVTFAAGQAQATETVEVLNRSGRQRDVRTVTVSLVDAEAYDVGEPASASLRVIDASGSGAPAEPPGAPECSISDERCWFHWFSSYAEWLLWKLFSWLFPGLPQHP